MNHKIQYKYNTIEKALMRVEEQKTEYEKNLVNKKFAYAFIDNNIICIKEIHFKKENYLHLTGLDYQKRLYHKRHDIPNISTNAMEFYNRIGDRDLHNDVTFLIGDNIKESRRYFVYTQHKLENLSKLTHIAFKAEYIGKYHGNQNFDIIINRSQNSIAFIDDGEMYAPTSSLYGDIDDVASDIHEILAIFKKDDGYDKPYIIVYLNKKVEIKKSKFDRNAIDKFNDSSFINSKVQFNQEQLECLIESYKRTKESIKE